MNARTSMTADWRRAQDFARWRAIEAEAVHGAPVSEVRRGSACRTYRTHGLALMLNRRPVR